MNIISKFLIMHVLLSCGSHEQLRSEERKGKSAPIVANYDSLNPQDTMRNKLSGKKITITVSYAAIACSCPQWFESKFKSVKFLKGVERFYLEPINKSLTHANALWNGVDLPFMVEVTGTFSKEKELPRTFSNKETPEKARIFWYEKITVLSPSGGKRD